MKRLALLKWFLRLSAISQIGYWSFSHLFFPGWYLRSVGLNELAANPGSSLIFIHEIGILTLGIGIATWLASNDPIKNIAIIIMLYVVSLGSIATSLFHIFHHRVATGEWTTVVIISVQVVILTVLYPWKELRGRI